MATAAARRTLLLRGRGRLGRTFGRGRSGRTGRPSRGKRGDWLLRLRQLEQRCWCMDGCGLGGRGRRCGWLALARLRLGQATCAARARLLLGLWLRLLRLLRRTWCPLGAPGGCGRGRGGTGSTGSTGCGCSLRARCRAACSARTRRLRLLGGLVWILVVILILGVGCCLSHVAPTSCGMSGRRGGERGEGRYGGKVVAGIVLDKRSTRRRA